MFVAIVTGFVVALLGVALQSRYKATRVILLTVADHVLSYHDEDNVIRLGMSRHGQIASFLMPSSIRLANITGQFLLPLAFLIIFRTELIWGVCGLFLGNIFGTRLYDPGIDRYKLVNQIYVVLNKKKELSMQSSRSEEWLNFISAIEMSLEDYQNDPEAPEVIHPSQEKEIVRNTKMSSI